MSDDLVDEKELNEIKFADDDFFDNGWEKFLLVLLVVIAICASPIIFAVWLIRWSYKFYTKTKRIHVT